MRRGTVVGDRIIIKNVPWKRSTTAVERHGIEIRNCGMSFTLSEIMATETTENDQIYEPYHGDKITTSWDSIGTIYGGYVDLISGELVQEYAKTVFTGAETENLFYYKTETWRGLERHAFHTTDLDRIIRNLSGQ